METLARRIYQQRKANHGYEESEDVANNNKKTEQTLKRVWWDWHLKNPHVYELFEQFAFEAISRGHRHCSAWLIVNRLRWESSIVTNSGDYKISNNFIAYYARLFMHKNPNYNNFFKTKKMKES